MIRRWSRLTIFNLVNPLKLTFKIETFKASVSFKRFVFKKTKFKRKTLSKWKHRSLWFPYLNLFKFWTLDYQFNKFFCKYQFLSCIFVNTFLLFNANYLYQKHLPSQYNALDINFISLTKKTYLYFFQKISKFVNFFKNYNLMFAFSTNLLYQLTNTEVKTIVNCYNNVTYEKNLELKHENCPINVIHFFLLNSLLNFFKEIYKIVIILIYLSLLKR